MTLQKNTGAEKAGKRPSHVDRLAVLRGALPVAAGLELLQIQRLENARIRILRLHDAKKKFAVCVNFLTPGPDSWQFRSCSIHL